jgi:hypothetical protein
MNREEHLMKTFPLEDGTTYIQSIDKANEPKGVGAGGESLKENFIDSASNEQSKSLELGESKEQKEKASDWMYNWIRKHSGK